MPNTRAMGGMAALCAAAIALNGCAGLGAGRPETVTRTVEVLCPPKRPQLGPCPAGDTLGARLAREECQAVWLEAWDRAYAGCAGGGEGP